MPDTPAPVAAVTAANAAAWLVGFFAFMAPGGLVVREGAMATLLIAWVPFEQAIAAATVWRMLQIGVELLCMVGALIPAEAFARREAQVDAKLARVVDKLEDGWIRIKNFRLRLDPRQMECAKRHKPHAPDGVQP